MKNTDEEWRLKANKINRLNKIDGENHMDWLLIISITSDRV